MDLDGKRALISGGGTGIGAAIARALHREGVQVMVCGRRSAPLEALCAELGEGAHWTPCDVSVSGSPAKAVDAAVEQMGGLDLLVNNAGVFLAKPLAKISDEELDLVIGVNLKGLLALTRESIPHLVSSKGAVINIGSVSANRPVPGASLYAGVKAAVEHVTRCLAIELGPSGVRVNCVAPGLTETPMSEPLTSDAAMLAEQIAATPLGRLGTPADIAPAVLYLATDPWVTGQVIQSSGGLWI
ncbi:MAG: SDR family oxidoreductase [Planctomycetes bacterium]|nr:SDR family oxidoreductase [Planctomycetota bacterium]